MFGGFRVQLLPDQSGIDTFAASGLQATRPGWSLLVLRVPKQTRPWAATLRLSAPDDQTQTIMMRGPFGMKVEIAHLPGTATSAEVTLHGIRQTPGTIGLWLQRLPAPLAGLVALCRRPRAVLRDYRAAQGTPRQRLHAVLMASVADRNTLPASYADWLMMYDGWSTQRLAPVRAGLGDRPAVHALVFTTRSDSAALAATRASLAEQSYAISGMNILRPGDAVPAVAAAFTLILQAGELLAWHALPLLLREIAAPNAPDAVFADEDRIRADGTRFEPSFKPQPGLMMICSGLLSRGAWLVRTAALPHGLVPGYAECLRLHIWFAQPYAPLHRRIGHVPHLLTHRRTDAKAAPPPALAAVIDAGLQTSGVRATAQPTFPLRLNWQPDAHSRIDIIVPSRLRGATQLSCLMDVLTRTTQPNVSMLIVVTQTTPLDAAQRDAAERIEATGRARVTLLQRADFNFAAVNNHAAAQTDAELICLLNDDVAVLDGDWLGQMAARFSSPATGIVGARLYYPDGRTQHGGVIMGLAGLAEHAHKFLPRGAPGYMSRAVLDQEMSAVTGACLMVRRRLFDQVGGLDEQLPTGFNDVDFCLRIGATGHDIVMAASVELTHHETLTFGHHYAHDTTAQMADAELMHRRWPEIIAADPYHNPNLSLAPQAEWALAIPPRLTAR